MTIGITGPERKPPRRSALAVVIIAAIVVAICLLLLGLASDLLVDWLWFSSIGYLQVFLTTIGAKAAVFFVVWTLTALILALNGWLARRFARRQPTPPVTGPAWSAARNRGATPKSRSKSWAALVSACSIPKKQASGRAPCPPSDAVQVITISSPTYW